jgi:peptidase M28-like protein
LVALLLLLTVQTPASVQRAAQSISADDIRRRVGIIADDSMRGRDTPSPGLEKTAAYIAREFRRLGLKPAGDNGSFLQRYALDQVKIVGDSTVAFVHGAEDVTLSYEKDFIFLDNTLETRDYMGEIVLIWGSLDGPIQVDTAALAGKVFVFFMRNRSPAQRRRAITWRPAALLALSPAPDSLWAAAVRQAERPQLRDPGRALDTPPILTMRYGSLAPLLSRLGADLAALQEPGGPLQAQSLKAQLHLHRRVRVVERKTAPNVVGVLEGSDPQLKREHIVFSAHMDHVGVAGPRGSGGCRAQGADSICNGADDDGSGTVAVLELAEAFTRLTPRPKRSMVFLTVSGEEKGLWGSAYFGEHPTVPMSDIVADFNIDMIGRNWRDTIVAIGKEHSDLGATLNRVAAAHPELNMVPIDDIWPQENFYFRSDHYNFARKGVPVLFFFSGTHRDYHEPGDSPDKIDAEKESRVAQLIFYLGLEVANAPGRPKWNPDSYRRIVSGN